MGTITAARRNTVQHRSHPLRPLPDRLSRMVLDLGTLDTTAPGCARAWTRRILLEWQLTCLSDSAELVVSELTANAMLASRSQGRPFIRLTLTLDQGELGIFVRDYCSGTPQPALAGDEDESGRGLLLVEAMSSRSGWYPPNDGATGKVVWAALSS
jgi:anti-sigma regulatory factor (Ser/Thr protein kinase)